MGDSAKELQDIMEEIDHLEREFDREDEENSQPPASSASPVPSDKLEDTGDSTDHSVEHSTDHLAERPHQGVEPLSSAEFKESKSAKEGLLADISEEEKWVAETLGGIDEGTNWEESDGPIESSDENWMEHRQQLGPSREHPLPIDEDEKEKEDSPCQPSDDSSDGEEASLEHLDEVEGPENPTLQQDGRVIPMEPPEASTPHASEGSVTFEMIFQIGGRCANLRVNGSEGLCLEMAGVKFQVAQESISFQLDDGGEFRMPWKESQKKIKGAA